MEKTILCSLILLCLLTGIACAEAPAYGNWTEITNDAGFGERGFFGSASFDNRLWVIGGTNPQSNLSNDVWSSYDGKQWDLVTNNASFSSRTSFGVTEFNNRLWVIGGANRNTGLKNDVWSSPDGKSWDLVTGSANFTPRSNVGIAVFNNRLWIIGGYGNGDNNDVWSSSDGKTWDLVTNSANFSSRSGHGVAVFDNRLWVVGGSGTNDVWSSTNGKNWILVSPDAPFKKMDFDPLVVFDNKLWIIGGGSYSPPVVTKGGFETSDDKVWSSPDGKNWTLETEHAAFGPRYLHSVNVFRNGIWVIGGEGSNYKDVWYMPALHPEKTLMPETSHVPVTTPAVISDELPIPKTTTTKSGIAPQIACVSLCIATGFCGWYGRKRLR